MFRIGSLGMLEILIVLLIVVLIFGVGRLGKLGEELGKGIRSFREAVSQDQSDAPASDDAPGV